MTTFYLKMMGPGRDRSAIEAEGVAEARNEAIRYLGQYLSKDPNYASEGHWQLNVENALGQSLVHVIVATVVPRGAPLEVSKMPQMTPVHSDDREGQSGQAPHV
jgi:hypothetical protein